RLGLHRTVTFEYGALVYNQHRRGQITEDPCRRPDFDPLGGKDIAADLPRHDDRRRPDLRGDDRAFADREALLTDDLTIDLAVNPDRALEGNLPTDLATAVEVRETRLLMGGLRL